MDNVKDEIRSVELNYKETRAVSGDRREVCSHPIKMIVIVFGALVLFGESALSAVKRWNELSRRFLAFEDVNIWIVMLAGMYHFYFLPKESQTILGIISVSSERQFHWLADNPEMHLLLKQFKVDASSDIKYIKMVLLCLLLNYILVPLFLTGYKMAVLNELSVMQYNLPFEFYNLDLPLLNKYTVFLAVNLLQIVFVKIIVDISKFMFISFAGPVNKIVVDIKLLCIAIDSLDSHIHSKYPPHFPLSSTDTHVEENSIRDIILRKYMRHIVHQHINICRNVAGLNKCIRVLAFYTIPSICVQICLLFYWILEVDSTRLHQLVDGTQVLAVCGYAYLYSSVGQNIINQDEYLRMTLLNCNWLDKPLWFRRSLLIMLTRATRQLSITPYRLFVVDYVHFTSMMNAAYSYYNFLRTTYKLNK